MTKDKPKARLARLSLYPLPIEDALDGALQVVPPPDQQRAKKKSKRGKAKRKKKR